MPRSKGATSLLHRVADFYEADSRRACTLRHIQRCNDSVIGDLAFGFDEERSVGASLERRAQPPFKVLEGQHRGGVERVLFRADFQQ